MAVYELNVTVVFASETKRDLLYDYVFARQDSPLAGDVLNKIDVFAGEELTGTQTYAVNFSIRFRNQSQRTNIVTWFNNNIKSNCIAYRVAKHLCGHDENKPCEASVLIDKWVKPTLTEQQKQDLITCYGDIGGE